MIGRWVAVAAAIGVVSAGVVSSGGASAAVVNGDFESVDGRIGDFGDALDSLAGSSGAGSWDVYTDVPGWKTADGAGIEIQTNGTLGSVNAQSGQHYVELDSHPKPSSNSTMQQSVVLAAGTYEFSFYYSPREYQSKKDTPSTNRIEYSLMSAAMADVTGAIQGPEAASGTTVGAWTLVTEIFHLDVESELTMLFAAKGDDNTYGGLIDTVQISAVPLPAGGVLLLTGLGVLGWLRRVRG